MLRTDVPGIDSRLLEQRVRQELAANPTDPVPAPPGDDGERGGASAADWSSIPAGDAALTAPPGTAAALPRDAGPDGPAPKAPEPGGPTGLIGRTMARLGALYRQHSRHHQLQRRISEIWGWAGETADRVHDLSRQIDALRLQLSALGDQHRELATLNRAQVEKQREGHDEHERRLARLDRAAVRLEGDLRFEHRRLARLIEAAGDTAGDTAGGGRPRATAPGGDARELAGRFVQEFEERFGGSREDKKGRLRVHLERVRGQPVVIPRHPLLDIGCGHGEWLELLAEAAVPAYGIDANPQLVDACRRRGLAVSQGDAIEHLARLPERALGAISAFHVIDHLALEDMLRLIDEARRTLVPNGILILETANSETLEAGALAVRHEPTRRRPLPPVLVEYLVSSRGFHEVELMRLHPAPAAALINEDSEAARRLNELLYGPQDIAVLARRA